MRMWRLGILGLFALGLSGATCRSPRPTETAGEAALTGERVVMLARAETGQAVELAGREALRLGRGVAETRRAALEDYLSALRASFEALHHQVPNVAAEATYDLDETRRRLLAADAAQATLTSSAAGVALELSDTLLLGARFLDHLDQLTSDLESGRHADDRPAVLASYQDAADAYNTWALNAGEALDELNEDLLGAVLPGSGAERQRQAAQVVWSGWPAALVDACAVRLEAVEPARPRSIVTVGQLGQLALSSLSPGCRAAAQPLIDAFVPCRFSVDGPVGADEALAIVRAAHRRLIDERATVCSSEPVDGI